MDRRIVFAALALLLISALAVAYQLNAPVAKSITPTLTNQPELCLTCHDGIEEIRDNGDIVITDEAHATFKEMLAIDARVITVKDSFEQALELKRKFHEFARHHGVAI